MIDNSLLKKAGKGDIDAFEAIILQYEKYIYNIAYRILYNPEDAKDASQETIIKIFKNINKCTEVNLLKSWIGRITTNTCIDELRKKSGKQDLSLDYELETSDGNIKFSQASCEKTPGELLEGKETMNVIQSALNKLSPNYKVLVVMRDVYGYSYHEISEITGVNIGTVKSRLNRARTRLRDILGSSEINGTDT